MTIECEFRPTWFHAAIVIDDDDTDILCGGGGRDLYFADLDGSGGSYDFILFDSPFEDIEEI